MDNEVVGCCNSLIRACGAPLPLLTSSLHVDKHVITTIYTTLFKLNTVVEYDDVLRGLSMALQMPLSHITVEELEAKHSTAIYNLLHLLTAYHAYTAQNNILDDSVDFNFTHNFTPRGRSSPKLSSCRDDDTGGSISPPTPPNTADHSSRPKPTRKVQYQTKRKMESPVLRSHRNDSRTWEEILEPYSGRGSSWVSSRSRLRQDRKNVTDVANELVKALKGEGTQAGEGTQHSPATTLIHTDTQPHQILSSMPSVSRSVEEHIDVSTQCTPPPAKHRNCKKYPTSPYPTTSTTSPHKPPAKPARSTYKPVRSPTKPVSKPARSLTKQGRSPDKSKQKRTSPVKTRKSSASPAAVKPGPSGPAKISVTGLVKSQFPGIEISRETNNKLLVQEDSRRRIKLKAKTPQTNIKLNNKIKECSGRIETMKSLACKQIEGKQRRTEEKEAKLLTTQIHNKLRERRTQHARIHRKANELNKFKKSLRKKNDCKDDCRIYSCVQGALKEQQQEIISRQKNRKTQQKMQRDNQIQQIEELTTHHVTMLDSVMSSTTRASACAGSEYEMQLQLTQESRRWREQLQEELRELQEGMRHNAAHSDHFRDLDTQNFLNNVHKINFI